MYTAKRYDHLQHLKLYITTLFLTMRFKYLCVKTIRRGKHLLQFSNNLHGQQSRQKSLLPVGGALNMS